MSAAERVADPLEEMVRRIVRLTLAEQQRMTRSALYSQDTLPPGMSKRTYLDHCYRGSWPSAKAGRLRITTAEHFDAWRDQHPIRAAKQREAVEEIADEVAYVISGGKKAKR